MRDKPLDKEQIFNAALTNEDPAERAGFLENAGGSDALRAELDELLEQHRDRC